MEEGKKVEVVSKEKKKLRGEVCPHFKSKDKDSNPICGNCINLRSPECRKYVEEEAGKSKYIKHGDVAKEEDKKMTTKYDKKDLFARARELKKQNKDIFGSVNFYRVSKKELIALVESGEKKLKNQPQESKKGKGSDVVKKDGK